MADTIIGVVDMLTGDSIKYASIANNINIPSVNDNLFRSISHKYSWSQTVAGSIGG